jgi:hypothetical protein
MSRLNLKSFNEETNKPAICAALPVDAIKKETRFRNCEFFEGMN